MRIIVFFVLSTLSLPALSQSMNLRVLGNSGFASFKGSGSAVATQVTNYTIGFSPTILANQYYGRNSGTSYGVELQASYTFKSNIDLGIGAGFESISTTSKVVSYTQAGIVLIVYDANGKTVLTGTYVNLNPYIGYTKSISGFKLGLKIGADFAIPQKLKAKTTYIVPTISKNEVTFTQNPEKPSLDIRPRVQATAEYNKIILSVGYAKGLTNYQTNNANGEAYLNYFRIGLGYTIL
ncbi:MULTISPECIES: hypothetical protein [unclassified Paraflavitalea]|uniref:hypothetical protein n=1 Tax=unclassified Paraflavitalea TaxID=2798305 RepID=UPI003D337730